MAKAKSRYVCNNCGEDFSQMYGKCPDCSIWGTFQEELIPTVSTNTNAIAIFSHLTATKALSSWKSKARESLTTAKEPLKSCSEMNRQKNSVYLAMLLVKPYDKARQIATKCTKHLIPNPTIGNSSSLFEIRCSSRTLNP